MEEQVCETCKHFVQHYRRSGRGYMSVNCGHCIYPRIKTRMPDTSACKYYKYKSEDMQSNTEQL